MDKPTLQDIAVSSIIADTGFRYTLDEANLTALMAKREAGIILDPIKVMKRPHGKFSLISGNHRTQVARNLNETTIAALVYDSMPTLEYVRMGIQENAGKDGKNPLPPTEDDLRMVLRDLVRGEVPTAQIKAVMPYPAVYITKLLNGVQAGELKRKKVEAQLYMAEHNCTPATAAEKVGLPVKAFMDHLARKDKRQDNFDKKNPHKAENARLGSLMGSFSRVFTNTSKQALKDLDEGNRDPQTVLKMVEHAEGLLKNAMNAVENVRARAEKLTV
jgi:hypothetical protein